MIAPNAVCSFILLVTSLAAMYLLTPGDNPVEYCVSAFAAVHGILGILRAIADEEDECNRVYSLSSSIMDIAPLTAANYELYASSGQSAFAPLHFLGGIPLFYDLLDKMSDEVDGSTDTLKDLTILANIASNIFLGVSEEKYILCSVAGVAFLARYGAAVINKFIDNIGSNIITLGSAGLIGLATYLITNK